jgi:FAD/FMN-containing dehydrogenase
MTVTEQPLDSQELAATVRGTVYRQDDAGYGPEVAGFYLATTHRPALAVAATCADDVAAAVRFAAGRGLPVAVQATGHGAVTAVDGGVLINTRAMADLAIDPRERTATVGAGVKWKAVVEAAAAHGLAPLNGSSSDVGVVGYTVGGGLPLMGRTYGFAADHVQRMTVVTADGEVREASPTSEPDLFWGLRGGKGNLGIVTEITVDLVPVRRIYGGGIFFPGEHAPELLRAYRDWVGGLDEQTNTSIALLRLPPIPDIPEPLRGRFVVHLRIIHVGDAESGERLVAPMRAVAPAIVDLVGEMPYTAIDSVHQDPDHPVPAHERGVLLSALDDAVVAQLLELAGPGVQTPVMIVEIRHLGGALSRPPAVANAVDNRDAAFVLEAIGVLMGPVAEIAPAATDALVASFARFSSRTGGATFVNFHGRPGDAADRARPWDPQTYARLCELKARFDPQNLFRFGHAIAPAAAIPAAIPASRGA